jgi:hypothetical protein
MQTQSKSGKLAVLAVLGSLLLSLTALASAESEAARSIRVSAASVPTNITGIHTYAEPPKGFDPLVASDEDLATYGFPPRPDQQVEPEHYATWAKAMRAAKIRWHGDLKALAGSEPTTIPTASSLSPLAVQADAGPQSQRNVTASGVVLTNTLKEWNTKDSFHDIYSIFTVATAQWPFDSSCSAAVATESSLVGIDGYIRPGAVDGYPVFYPGIAGGVSESIGCGESDAAYYAVAILLYPFTYQSFAVNPGDVFYAEASVENANLGFVFLTDLTSGVNSSFEFENTEGFVGQTAEWVLYRNCCSSSAPDGEYPLANTVNVFFDDGNAANISAKTFYPGSQASSTLILTMYDNNETQITETVDRGTGGDEGQHSLLFTTTGCAFEGGCP